MNEQDEGEKKISRRSALKVMGGVAAGVAITGIAVHSPVRLFSDDGAGVQGRQHPWPYKELDTEKLRKLGHEGYYLGNCSSGAFYAVMSALQEEVGSPYTGIPVRPPNNMMQFGGGGIVSQGMCCGALLGVFAAVNQVTDSERAGEIIRELVDWYKTAEFPSNISNEYGANREFLVDDYLSDEVIPQTVADSAFCADSVNVFMDKTGISYGDDRRKERCARLTGDVVAKAVELLNAT